MLCKQNVLYYMNEVVLYCRNKVFITMKLLISYPYFARDKI